MTDKQFNSLTKTEQRVQIAKDIIKQVKLEKFIATTGSYIRSIFFKDENYDMYESKNKDIKKNYNKIQSCRVCEIGSCIMSITKYKNNLTFEEIDNMPRTGDDQTRLLRSVFTPHQLLLKETAFEGNISSHKVGQGMGANLTMAEIQDCKSFYNEFQDDSTRLIEIQRNIIKHKGTFVPKDL